MKEIKKKYNCRLCNSKKLVKSIDLGKSPLANQFLNFKKKSKTYPLKVVKCLECNHLQLSHVVDPKVLFSKYLFVSGTSKTNLVHFKKYADECSFRFLKKHSKILDIASNDGSFLKFFNKRNTRVGIDPAKNIISNIKSPGYFIENKFFNLKESERLKKKYGKFNLITANNVCAHVDEFINFIKGVKNLLETDGVFVFEVGYFHEVYKNVTFDTIYHEHVDYHLFNPLIEFFKRFDLEIFDAKNIFIQGGSLRVYVAHKKKKILNKKNINKLINNEKKINYSNQKLYKDYQKFIENRREELLKTIRSLKNKNYKIAGYGASAKSTTFLNFFKIDSNKINFIADLNPMKQFKFSPGSNIKILPPSEIYKQKIDYIIILSWNFSKEIINENIKFIENGGKFILPFPKIITVNKNNYKFFLNI
jgi:SAM-dependent methyltransferase